MIPFPGKLSVDCPAYRCFAVKNQAQGHLSGYDGASSLLTIFAV